MEIPQISIVVPVYNVEKYLERCIDSILAQTFTDFELLLINDGSKDSSGLICDKYAEKDSRIRVFHKENEGVSRARNLGISNARGRWLGFIDSDDWVDKEYLHCFGDVFNYPDDIIVIQGMERIDGIQGRTLWQVKYPNKCLGKTDLGNGIAHFRLLHSGFPVLKLFNLCIIKQYRILFDTKISYHEDHLYVFNYLKYVTRIYLSEGVAYKYMYNARKLVYIDFSFYNYDRRRTDSITGEKFREANLDACWAFRERVDFFEKHGIKSLERKMNDIYCWILLDRIYQCYRQQVNGPKVKALVEQARKDVDYLQQHDVDPWYIEEFKLLSKGLEKYGMARSVRERK